MSQRVTTECVSAQQININRKHDCADADAERTLAADWIDEPESFPHIIGQNENKNERDVKKVAMHILHDERERALAKICFARLAHGACWWIRPKRLVVRAPIVVTRESKAAGRPKDQQRGRED